MNKAPNGDFCVNSRIIGRLNLNFNTDRLNKVCLLNIMAMAMNDEGLFTIAMP